MSEPARPSQTVTIVAACLATAMLMLDISVINTALSDIASGLDTGLSGLHWLVDAYTIPLAATVLTAGAIADRFGRRKLFVLGLGVFTASSALCGAAPGIEVLVGARAIQGLGASMMFATALALISQATPDGRGPCEGACGIRRRDRRLVRARAVHRRWADGAVRLARDLPRQRADRRCSSCGSPTARSPKAATRHRDGSTCRTAHAHRRVFLLVLALLRGNEEGWGSAGIVAALAGSAGSC